MDEISFNFHETPPFDFDESLLKAFLTTIFIDEGFLIDEVAIVFCSDNYLLGINREFLKHDYYTDIITFSLSEPDAPANAEIYISIDRVKENAERYCVSFSEELYRVMIHGVLHLCGFSDHTSEMKQQMTAKEDEYLQKLGST